MSGARAPHNDQGARAGAWLAWGPAAIYLFAVFYMGSIAVDPISQISFEWKDKVMHALGFGIMQRTHFRVLEYHMRGATPGRLALLSFLSASLVGVALEVWQAFLPHRMADVADALANTLGAGLFAWFWPGRRGETGEGRGE